MKKTIIIFASLYFLLALWLKFDLFEMALGTFFMFSYVVVFNIIENNFKKTPLIVLNYGIAIIFFLLFLFLTRVVNLTHDYFAFSVNTVEIILLESVIHTLLHIFEEEKN